VHERGPALRRLHRNTKSHNQSLSACNRSALMRCDPCSDLTVDAGGFPCNRSSFKFEAPIKKLVQQYSTFNIPSSLPCLPLPCRLIFLFLQFTHVIFSQRFPEVYTGCRAPPALGTRDKERNFGTPCYVYGWIISRVEVYEALYGEQAPMGPLPYIHRAADTRLYKHWTEKGYLDNEYK